MKDGGPAFPLDPETNRLTEAQGMSLRDWFAGQALNGCIANTLPSTPEQVVHLCRHMYEVADQMLAAREKAQS